MPQRLHSFVWRMCVLALAAIGSAFPDLPSALAQTSTVDALTGQSCAGTRFGSNLGCTANDFSSTLTFDQPAATALSSCVAGQVVTIDVLAQTTSNSPVRYDGAYFIGESGFSPELNDATRSCSLGVFPTNPAPFVNLDGDTCGDYQATASSTLLIRGIRVSCTPAAGTNLLMLPYVLVFNNQTGGATCNASNITANTRSKCVSSVSSTVTGVVVNGYVRLTKQTLPDGHPQSFNFSVSSSGTAASPSNFNLTDGNSQLVQVPLSPTGGGVTITIAEALASGWDSSASISCTTPTGGSAASYVSVNNVSRTITATLTAADFGAECTITNTKPPTVSVQKTTIGGAGGPFTFVQTNLVSTPAPITTAAAATPTPSAPVAIRAASTGSPVTLTESTATGFFPSGAACTDASASLTGNTGSFGTLSGNTLTIPGARVVNGAEINCVFSNTLAVPNLAVSKTASLAQVTAAGQVITYPITVSNTGNVAVSSVTVADSLGTPVCAASGTATIASLAPGASETCTVSYTITQADMDNAGGTTTQIQNVVSASGNADFFGPYSSGSFTVSTPVSRTAAIAVTKTASAPGFTAGNVAGVPAGTVITYTYVVQNTGNQTIANIGLSDVHNGNGPVPVPGSEAISDDSPPSGDSSDATPGDGVWSSLAPGDAVTFLGTYTVTQQDVDLLQ